MIKSEKCAQGFTLIELLVAISVLVLMLVVGVPSFSSLIDSNKVRTTRDILATAVNSAQQRATSQNIPVYLCPTKNETSCAGSWNDIVGWLAYADLDRGGDLDNDEIFLIQSEVKAEEIRSLNSVVLTFSATGHATENTFYICSSLDNGDDLQFSVSRSGRISYGTSGDLCN